MVFVVCGLNHKTAPLAVREKMALPEPVRAQWLEKLSGLHGMHGVMILSTCNRTEILCDMDDPHNLMPWIAAEAGIPRETLSPSLYLHVDEKAVRHALRVACGLDSMMPGEPQILGQMKLAHEEAAGFGLLGETLGPIFQQVFRASKRIRSQSGIGNNPVSVASAAVHLATRLIPNPVAARVFLIGSGETAALVARYLFKQGVTQFLVASRTLEHAQELALQYHGEAITVQEIAANLARADIVISATSCPLPFIDRPMVEAAMAARHGAPMVLLDLAMPRDIAPEAGMVDGVHLHNLDDLRQVTEQGLEARRACAARAEELVSQEVEKFTRWYRAIQAKTIICDYREQMQSLAQQEIDRAMRKLASGDCQYTVFEEFSQRLLKKLTHTPSVGLRQSASDGREELLQLFQYMYTTRQAYTPHEKVT